jgi:Zn-dependent protease with chaperone function
MKPRILGLPATALFVAGALLAQAAPEPAATPGVSASTGGPTSYTLTPEKYRRAVAYARARYGLHFLSSLWSALVLVVIIGLRLVPRFRNRAEAVSKRRFWQAAIFVPLLLVTESVLELPTGIYGQHISRLYDQSVQGWGSWFWDWTKGQLVGFVIAIPLAWLLYAILRRSPRRWWLWFWLALLPIIVFLVFVSPFVVDPLFFRFEPLAQKNPELASKIEEVTVRAGRHIPKEKMFEMNASSKYKSLNAYVTGLGASKRVVVWDTLIARETLPQALFTFGHEMGHYVLLHIPKAIAFSWALLFVFLALARWILSRLFGRPDGRWGIRSVSDWASLPVLLLLATIAGELAQPVVNGFSRSEEHDADIFGLEAIHGIVPESQRVAAEGFQLDGEVNLADPNPSSFIRIWLYSHPPLAERLRFAAEYDPWGKGQQPKFLR